MKKSNKLISLAITLSLSATNAFATSELAIDPVQVLEGEKPSGGARGMLFIENVDAGVSVGWIRYSHTPRFGTDGSVKPSDYWNWTLCKSWDDSSCPNRAGYTLEGKVILGSCTKVEEIGCVKDFRVIGSDGVEKKIKYEGPSYSGVQDIPESKAFLVPRSSSPQIYSDDEGQLYVVRAGIWVNRTGKNSGTDKLDVDVTPVIKTVDPILTAPVAQRTIDQGSKLNTVVVIPSPSNCVSIDIGICYKAIKMSKEFKFGVEVRVPRSISGWLRGRVSQPKFDTEIINSDSLLISVEASPAVMPVAGGWVKYSELPSNFLQNLYPTAMYETNPDAAYFLVGSPSQGSRGMEEYLAWMPYFKDKAVTTLTTWSFGTNLSGNDRACLKDAGNVTGFVATNASVYSSNPPDWDATASTLSYKVGSPHLDEAGVENVGTYTLAMPLSTIQCLYGQTSLPPSATVSLAYGSEVVNVATVTLKSDSGWVYFSANGFHYSNPTIQVKFIKPAQPVGAEKNPAPNTVIKIQWCAKGNAKKKVTAVNPVCPKGYKKIKAPL